MSVLNALRLPARSLSHYSSTRTISSTVRKLATNTPRSEAGQVISEVSKQEGGTHKGKIIHNLPCVGFRAYLTTRFQGPLQLNCNPK